MDGGKGLGSRSKDFFLPGFFKNIFYLFITTWVFIAVHRLSLVVASGGSSLVAMHRLVSVTFLVAEHEL